MTQFHFPLDFSCPLQQECHQFSGILSMKVRQVKLLYLQEQMLRVVDYFLVQFLESLADTDPFEQMIEL